MDYSVKSYFLPTNALMKLRPLGVPRPVTLSHPLTAFNDESVPNVSAYQRVEVPWYIKLMKST